MSEHHSPDDERSTSGIVRQFTRAYISIKDLAQCASYLDVFEKVTDPIVRRGLFTAAVIAYARPFSENKSHRLAAPKAPISLKRLTSDQRILHARLCDIRNKAIAHSDYELNPSELLEFYNTGFLVESRFYEPLNEQIDVKSFQALVQAICYTLMECMQELARKGAKAGTPPPNPDPDEAP
jgi:hypothetical protein